MQVEALTPQASPTGDRVKEHLDRESNGSSSYSWESLGGNVVVPSVAAQVGDEVMLEQALIESILDAEGPPELEWTTSDNPFMTAAGGADIIAASGDQETQSLQSYSTLHSALGRISLAQPTRQSRDSFDQVRSMLRANVQVWAQRRTILALIKLIRSTSVQQVQSSVLRPFNTCGRVALNLPELPVPRRDVWHFWHAMGRGRILRMAASPLWWGRMPAQCRALIAEMVGVLPARLRH